MATYVRASKQRNSRTSQHFFEVRIEGLRDAPPECTSPRSMKDFLSQVAPVPYPPNFPYRDKLESAAVDSGIELEEIGISVASDGKNDAVFKLYDDEFEFGSGTVQLTDCEVVHSQTGRWWAWIGKKDESGAYTDPRVRGLRVRVRNIQIDGADIFRSVFQERAKSYARFQDYFLGEIFIKPTALVPNARRDGFEEDKSWRSIRKELGAVATALGREAYALSNAGKLSLDAQREALKKTRQELGRLKKSNFSNIDKTVALSRSIATNQGRIAKAMEAADMTTSAALAAIGSEFADIKIEALRHVGDAAETLDRERLETEARDELIEEILEILEEQLSPKCMTEVRSLLSDYL